MQIIIFQVTLYEVNRMSNTFEVKVIYRCGLPVPVDGILNPRFAVSKEDFMKFLGVMHYELLK